MAPQLCRLGVRAKVTCLSKFVHPSQHICDKYPNPVSGHCLEGCVVVCQELKKVSRHNQLCIVVHHDEFKTADSTIVELHAVKRYWKKATVISSLMILLQRRRGRRNQFQLHCLMSSIKQSMDNPLKTTQSKHSVGW